MKQNVLLQMKCWLCCLVLGLTVNATVATSLFAATDVTDYDAIAVFTQESDDRFSVYFSTQKDGEWQEPVVLSDNDLLNIVPSITVGSTGEIWVVWAVFNSGDIDLYMKRYTDDAWTEEEKIETGLSSNIAPSIAFDSNGILWLVWAGGDGQDDDIYYSTWNGSAFEAPLRITDNEVPDVQPVLGVTEDGELWVQWQMATEEGDVPKSAHWDSGAEEWVVDTLIDANTRLKEAMVVPAGEESSDEESLEVELPDYIEMPQTAAFFFPGKQVQSLPYRLIEEPESEEAATVDSVETDTAESNTIENE